MITDQTQTHPHALQAVSRLDVKATRIGLRIGIVVGVLGHVGALQALSSIPLETPLRVAPSPALYEYKTLPDEQPADEPSPTERAPEPAEPDDSVPEMERRNPTADRQPLEEIDDPYEDDVPAAAAAADVLTAEVDDEIADMTGPGWDIVDGASAGPLGGYQSAQGTARQTVRDPRASVAGSPGARGAGGSATPRVNLARPAGVLGGSSWSCPFPAQADAAQVNRAVATVSVTVSPKGRALRVVVLSDPGHGFGAAASRCALGRSYRPARDTSGQAIVASTPPIVVRFRR